MKYGHSNLLINITDQINDKKMIMKIYESQLLYYDYINHIDIFGRARNLSKMMIDQKFTLSEYKFNIKHNFANSTTWTHAEAFIKMSIDEFLNEIKSLLNKEPC